MLSKKIGIDLGTSTVLVYVKGEGVVVNEPALMAMDEKGARILAIGRAASDLVDRNGKARAIRPVRDGDGVDYEVAGAMLQHLIGRIVGRQRIFRPDVMLSVAPTVTGVERRAVLEATMQAGAKTAYLIDKPMAAALGARVSVATTDGIIVANLGASSTEIAAIALGEVLVIESIRVGGEALDRAIETALSRDADARLQSGEAEHLKIAIGSAIEPPQGSSMEVASQGGDGKRAPIHVDAKAIHAALKEPLHSIAAALQRVIGAVPAERVNAVRRNGVVLTGGAAQLRGITEFLAAEVGIPVRVAREPQTCVAVGTGMALDNLQVIRRGQHYIT